MNWTEFWLGAMGILLTIVGWHLEKAAIPVIVQRIFFPKYRRAKNAYDRMLSGIPIARGEPGFDELSSLVSQRIRESPPPVLTKLEASKAGEGMFFGYIGPTIRLQVETETGQSVTSSNQEHDLAPDIAARFLEPGKKLWGNLFFWSGIVLSAINLFT